MRSVSEPSTIIAMKASRKASQNTMLLPASSPSQPGSTSWKPTKVSAAKNTIAPWAKLNTPDAL